MFAIEIDGAFLEQRNDQKIRLKTRGQLFFRDFVAAGYTYPLNIPYTPTNARLMRYYDRIANVRDIEPIPCRVWLGGNFWRTGLVQYRRYDNGYDIDVQIPEDESILSLRKVSTKDLTDTYSFALFGADQAGLDALIESYYGTIEDTDVVLPPVRNTGKFAGRKETFLNADTSLPLNNNLRPVRDFTNTYNYSVGHPTYEVYFNDLTPMPYLVRVFEKMMALVGRTLTGDVIADPEVRQQVVLNNLHVCVLIQEDGVLEINVPVEYYTVKLADMLPEFTGLEFLLRMMRRYNAVPLFEGGNIRFRSLNDILSDPRFDDLTEWMEPRAQMELEKTTGLRLTELKEPLDKQRGTAVKFDPARIIGTVSTVSALSGLTPQSGDLALVAVTNKLYRYSTEVGFTYGWSELGDYFPEFSVGTDPKALDVGVGFTSMWRGNRENATNAWVVPNMQMVLHDPYGDIHSLGINPTEQLRLLFCRGQQFDAGGYTYLMATNDNRLHDGTTIPGVSQRELLDGDGGIYNTWYKRWFETLSAGKFITRRLRMPLHKVRTFQWDRKIMLEGNLYLCREMDIELTTTGYGLVNMELLHLGVAGGRTVGEPVVFECVGAGYAPITIRDSGGVVLTTSTGYYSLRNASTGAVLTYATAAGLQSPGAGVYCAFPSDAEGEPTGNMLYFDAVDTLDAATWTGWATLTRLGASTSNLTEVDLRDLVLLEILFLEGPFPDLDLGSNILLQNVNVSGSNLENINLSTLAVMTTLSIGNSIIDSPDLSGNAALVYLTLKMLGTTLDLSVQANLRSIVINGISLVDITLHPSMSLADMKIVGAALDTATVDALCNALDPTVTGAVSNISGGTSAAPTAASAANRAAYIANGNSLITN